MFMVNKRFIYYQYQFACRIGIFVQKSFSALLLV